MQKNTVNIFKKPRVLKVVVNIGLGRMSQVPQFEEKMLPEVMKELASITGQYPKTNAARKSIAGFKIRTGQVIGLMVTLRGKRSRDFLGRLINLVLPRIKDFRGLSLKNIDSHGNLNIGLKEQLVFPEISPEFSKVNFGLEITIVTSAKDQSEAVEFYRSLRIPLRK